MMHGKNNNGLSSSWHVTWHVRRVLQRVVTGVVAGLLLSGCDLFDDDDDQQLADNDTRVVVVVADGSADAPTQDDSGASDLAEEPVVSVATVTEDDAGAGGAATEDSDDQTDTESVTGSTDDDSAAGGDQPVGSDDAPESDPGSESDDSGNVDDAADSDDASDTDDAPVADDSAGNTASDDTEDNAPVSDADSSPQQDDAPEPTGDPPPVETPDNDGNNDSVVETPDESLEIVSFDGSVPAFPGAEGHGASARGGRGGIVVKVTNLNDSGPGSLRAAMMMTEPRMILFEVSGTIALQQQIRLKAANSYFTIAGQTAPGDGIAIRNHKLVFDGVTEGIVRHLRLRHGCASNCTVGVADNLTLLGDTSLLIFDHLSMTWAEDEVMDVWGDNIRDITFQWSMMGEGTVFCVEGASQNLGPLIGGGDGIHNVTFANNFIAHTCYRNFMQSAGQVSFVNNMSYNTFKLDYSFSVHPRSTEQISADIVGHYFREGPQADRRNLIDVINAVGSEPRPAVSLHIQDVAPFTVSGDVHPFFLDDPYSLVSTRSIGSDVLPRWQQRNQPLPAPQFPVSRVPSFDVPDKILGSVGASLPRRDEVDQRLVESFHTLRGWESVNLRQYPDLQTYDLRIDSDDDGMPDDWEVSNGLDPFDGNDHAGDIDNDGYSNIENFINSLR
jgi:hypothetical protein